MIPKETVAEVYFDLGKPKKASRIFDCSERVQIVEAFNKATGELHREGLFHWRCHSSLCPICMKIKSSYERYVGHQILQEILLEHKVLSLTLTLESVGIYKLRAQVKALHDIFRKLRNHNAFRPFMKRICFPCGMG